MKKKLTTGEKRESRLRYLYRQWIRAGIIKIGTPMKLVRDVLENKITLLEKKPRKKRVSGKPTPPSKKYRRKTRKSLRAKFRNIITRAKLERRERRKVNAEKKREATRLLRVLAEEQVRSLHRELHGKPGSHANLSGVQTGNRVRKGKGKKVLKDDEQS